MPRRAAHAQAMEAFAAPSVMRPADGDADGATPVWQPAAVGMVLRLCVSCVPLR